MKYDDARTAYEALKAKLEDQEVVTCLDLGDEWLFKFVPKEAVGDKDYISGLGCTLMNKKDGKVHYGNITRYMKAASGKENLADKLRRGKS